MLATILEWALRAFGGFWIIGSGFAFYHARQAALMDQVLGALSGEPEDPLVTRFLFIGSVLTLICGAGLAAASGWVLIPLALLLLSQVIYFRLKRRRFLRAASDEAREDARVAPSTRNAFALSIAVTVLAVIAVQVGVFAL